MKTDSTNCWIFQASPKKYDINTELVEKPEHTYWRVSQHKNEIKVGDEVFIWRGDEKNKREDFPRGVIAYGIICEEAVPVDVNNLDACRKDLYFSNEEFKEHCLRVKLKLHDIRLTLDDGMIPAFLLKEDVLLGEMAVVHGFPQTNISLNADQALALKKMWNFINTELDFEKEDYGYSAYEGKPKYKRHLIRERNSQLRNKAVKKFKDEHGGKIHCELCEFSFEKIYGELGKDFIEVHHKIWLSAREVETETKIEDLMMLCANCHRMEHRKKLVE